GVRGTQRLSAPGTLPACARDSTGLMSECPARGADQPTKVAVHPALPALAKTSKAIAATTCVDRRANNIERQVQTSGLLEPLRPSLVGAARAEGTINATGFRRKALSQNQRLKRGRPSIVGCWAVFFVTGTSPASPSICGISARAGWCAGFERAETLA